MQRDDRYDFYKGLLMFSVVFGHVITALANGISIPSGIHVFVRTFDMPAFAFISGFFLRKSCRKHPFHVGVLNKIGSILFPAFLWSGIINILLGDKFFSIGRLWFLWSIFFVSCVILIIDRIGQKVPLLKLPLFILAVILFHTIVIDPWNIGFLLFPAVVGYYDDELKMLFAKARSPRIAKLSIMLMFVICLLFWSKEYNVWNAGCNILEPGAFIKIIFRGIIGVVGWFAVKIVYDYVYGKIQWHQSCVVRRIKGGLIRIGRTTLEIYILQTIFVEFLGHTVVAKIVNFLGMNPFAVSPFLLTLVFAPIVTVCALVVMHMVNVVMKKLPGIGKYIYGITWVEAKQLFGGHLK